MHELVFLKLGGSLITDKTRPYTARVDKLADLVQQIAAVRASTPDLRLVLGHGSGSFGHTAAKEYKTREGTDFPREDARYWKGFAEVHFQATRLNDLVMIALHEAGLAALAFAPAGSVTARQGQITAWDIRPIQAALENGILPVVYGDAVFEEVRGGTIVSTEDLFEYLARGLSPDRILLAGLEPGVWEDFPGRTRLLNEISPKSYATLRAGVGSAIGVDVTGGMGSKVEQMLKLVQELGITAQIFSGDEPGNLERALENKPVGTLISS
jgi:isopentenyl phosphate kinase